MFYYFKSKQSINMDELEKDLNVIIEDEFFFEMLDNYGGYIETGISIRDELNSNIDIIVNDLGYNICFLSMPIKHDIGIYLLDIMSGLTNKHYICLADLLTLAMIAQNTKTRYILSHLFDHVEREVLKSVVYYVRGGGNVIKTAKMLYIHRNTLNYRLGKFMNETGYDLRDSEQLQLIYLYSLINNY